MRDYLVLVIWKDCGISSYNSYAKNRLAAIRKLTKKRGGYINSHKKDIHKIIVIVSP